MTLARTSQGSERPGQRRQPQVGKGGFQIWKGHGENLGGYGDVPHHIIRTKSSLSSSFRSPVWAKEWSAKGVFSRGRTLRPCHESNVDLGYFHALAIVNSAAVNI